MSSSNVYVIIPALNEASRIGKVIYATRLQGFDNIIVVDDGSSDNTSKTAVNFGATVLYHQINLGPGAATQTGIEYALEQGADIIVTIDADHQHFPEDIPRLLDTLHKESVDVVIGSRFLQDNDIPSVRRFYNRIGNWLTALITGIFISDSQSGMKAFRAGFARKIAFNFNGYEFCTEFIFFLRRFHASYREVPINVRYSKETLEKGQSFGNGVKMALRFFKHFM